MRIQINTKISVIGCGFIGQALIRNLLSKGFVINVLDRNACPQEFQGRVNWTTGSFNDKQLLKAALDGVKIAYHLIASTVPGDSHISIATELTENVIGTLEFIDTCLGAGVSRIVFSSSSSVYGVQNELPIKESQYTNPISSHGIHKLMIEKYLLLASFRGGIDVRILRIANPYGPEQNIFGRQGFIAMTIGNIINGLPVKLSNDGKVVRDFIYIDDLAEAMSLCGLLDKLPSIMNIGTQNGVSLIEIVNIISRLLKIEIKTESIEPKNVDIPSSILDVQLMIEATSFAPNISLKDGISRTLMHHGFTLSDQGAP